MFNDAFRPLVRNSLDLFPPEIEQEHARLSRFIYENVNNGVYKAGFATTQRAYEKPVRALFAALDELENRLENRRYLLDRGSSRRIGVCFALLFGSTPFTISTSNVICAESSITQICRGI